MNVQHPSLTAQYLADVLGGDVASPDSVLAPGPGHSPKDRSLSIKLDATAPDGFVVCSHAGDDWRDCRDHVAAKMGMAPREPKAKTAGEAPRRNQSRRVAEYIYRLEDGSHYLKVIRLKDPKSFPQEHWTGSGWAKGKPKDPKIPYRLPELVASPNAPVLIVEGEKDADNLARLGLVATTSSEGAGKWTEDLNERFKGRTVYILADNDDAGRKHARQVAENLHGVAKEVRVVHLPGLPEKGDVSDWLDAGGDEEELLRLCEEAPLWTRGEAAQEPELADQPAEVPVDLGDDFDLSQDGLATDLGARSWDQNAKHVAAWGQWLFWDDTRWARDENLAHLTRARAYLNTRASELAMWAAKKGEEEPEKARKLEGSAKSEARTLRHASTVAAVVSLARSNRASAAVADDFDQDLRLLGTPGGTVDLTTGQLRAAKREDCITRLTSVAPAHGSPARWLTLLNEIFQGDRELIAFLQRAAGYSLTGETSEHKLLFPYGTGANGKSTFLETLLRIWGDYARRIPASSLLNSNVEKHPTDLAGLRGARLAVGSELERGKSWNESAIKDMTGGDLLTARLMRQNFFDFRPQFTLWIAGNTMPSFKGVDEALRRRVALIPFTVTIPPEKRDPDLPKKLMAEGGRILSWAIEGAVEWQRRGLDVPSSVAVASKEYMDGEDTLGQFLADETVLDPQTFTTSTDLHVRFRQWSERQGLTSQWSVNTFSKELRSRGFSDDRRKYGRGFLGLKLKVG